MKTKIKTPTKWSLYIPGLYVPQSERGSNNYSVSGETWSESFRRACFAKKFARAITEHTGELHSVLRHDKKVWRPDTKKWGNA